MPKPAAGFGERSPALRRDHRMLEQRRHATRRTLHPRPDAAGGGVDRGGRRLHRRDPGRGGRAGRRPGALASASPHRGISPSLNDGLREARAPVVAIQDADDWSEPTRLERQLEVLDAPGAPWWGAACTRWTRRVAPSPRGPRSRAGDVRQMLMRFNPIPTLCRLSPPGRPRRRRLRPPLPVRDGVGPMAEAGGAPRDRTPPRTAGHAPDVGAPTSPPAANASRSGSHRDALAAMRRGGRRGA